MITELDAELRRLLAASGARAAVIWSQHTQPRRAVVVCSCPLDMLPAGTALPLPDELGIGIQRDPARLAAVIPTSVRVRLLPDSPTAAESFELDGGELVLQLIWCSPLAINGIGPDLRLLITEQIGPLAREMHTGQQGASDAGRHLAVIDGLREGVVSVDFGLGVAQVNLAAARMLNLYHGEIPAADFADAMAKLMKAATNRAEIAAENAVVLHDKAIPAEVIWRFPTPPTHLRVSSSTVAGKDFDGRIWSFTDESELCEALEENEAAAAQARAIVDALLDPQVLAAPVRDNGGKIIDFTYEEVNRATCEYLGMSREQLLGTALTVTLPNIDRSGLLAHYIRCAETAEPVVLDDFLFYNEILQDARRYDIRAARARPDGTLTLTWRDVTERAEAAARIAASEEQYRLLSANSSDVVTRVRDGRFLWLSASAEGLLGAPAEHWVGRRVAEIIPPEQQDQHRARLHRLDSGETFFGRVEIIDTAGNRHWIHLNAAPFYDSSGRQDGATATLRCIDDEVAAERAAEEARREQARADALYRRSMDSAAVGMCLADLEGNFIEVNPAICEFFGYDADTLKKMTWLDLTAADYLQADLHNREEVLEGRSESYRMVKQFIHADGHPIWGDLAVSCVRAPDGQVEVFIGQITDITARVEADERSRVLSEHLQQQTERTKAELDSAANYMSSIMPSALEGRVAVSSRYLPSRELGGDCFDYHWLDGDHLIFYLIDVSGHGIEPALLAVSVHNMLRSGSLPRETLLAPAEVLAELNRRFKMDDHSEHYFTMWVGVYQASTRTLRYASAGAPPALVFTAGANPASELRTATVPVGVFEDTEFISSTHPVPPGSRILLYSDGAYEFTLQNGRRLSLGDFTNLASRHASRTESTLDDLLDELRALGAARSFEDDCSLIELSFP